MQIAANKAVSIDYTLTNDAGDVIDSSAGGAPLVYLHGAGNIIVGLEKALEGKNVGDELSVAIEPEDAYGEYSAELVATLTREMFEGVDELEVGMQFHASAPDGGMQIVTIRDIDGDDVTVDGNHPLAGQPHPWRRRSPPLIGVHSPIDGLGRPPAELLSWYSERRLWAPFASCAMPGLFTPSLGMRRSQGSCLVRGLARCVAECARSTS